MPSFSATSRSRLETCDTRLQEIFNRVVEKYDCTIICGHRSKEAQDEAVAKKLSKTPYPTSKHNSLPSKAVDAAPYPIDWNNTKRFYHFAGYVTAIANEMGYTIRWGGDWDRDYDLDDQKFMDLPHFEVLD